MLIASNSISSWHALIFIIITKAKYGWPTWDCMKQCAAQSYFLAEQAAASWKSLTCSLALLMVKHVVVCEKARLQSR